MSQTNRLSKFAALKRIPSRNAEHRVAGGDDAPGCLLASLRAENSELLAALKARDRIQQQLQVELEDARLLQEVSAMLVDENSIGNLYQKLVETARRIMRSDFATIQRLDEQSNRLQIIAHIGLNEEALSYWQWVNSGQATTCGRALQLRERVIVEEFDTYDFFANTPDLVQFQKAGVHAAQSTPLLTRTGKLVGMITTHWTCSHVPSERDLWLLDMIARQAADLIERNSAVQVLRSQAIQLEEANRNKDEFLATLAHELRNPLAPIQTGLDILKIGRPEQAPRIISLMDRQLGNMVRLVDDLLDVSRISRGAVTLQPAVIELSDVLESAVETSRPLLTAANHRFSVTSPGHKVWLRADPTRVSQIISNLLNNAAKYTPPEGQIQLVAEVLEHEVLIRVRDTGIGIAPQLLEKIFDLFTRSDDAVARVHGGLGVGLALAKQLAEMHGGSIQAQSAGGGEGATFTLRLPITMQGTNDASQDAEAARAASGEQLRILVVDDNLDAAETLSMLLEEIGHVTKIEVDATKAVDSALAFHPDVAVLDIGMPHLNGFDLARCLRAEHALSELYIIALSGWGTDADRVKGESAGFHHHLTKPVVLNALTSALENAASHSKAM